MNETNVSEAYIYGGAKSFLRFVQRILEESGDAVESAHIVVYSQKSVRVLDMRLEGSPETSNRYSRGDIISK